MIYLIHLAITSFEKFAKAKNKQTKASLKRKNEFDRILLFRDESRFQNCFSAIYLVYPTSLLILCTSIFKVIGAAAILASYFGARRVSCGSMPPFCFVFSARSYGKQRAVRVNYFGKKKPASRGKIHKWKTSLICGVPYFRHRTF